jgi:prophage regulatory protein
MLANRTPAKSLAKPLANQIGDFANFARLGEVEALHASPKASEVMRGFAMKKTNLIRRGEVQARTGLARSTMYELIKRGDFPGPVKISERAVAWCEDEVQAWIDERIERNRSEDSSDEEGDGQ